MDYHVENCHTYVEKLAKCLKIDNSIKPRDITNKYDCLITKRDQ